MSHNIDLMQQDGILMTERLFLDKTSGQNIQELDNQITLTQSCKLPITIVFWDISGFSRLAKTFYEVDEEDLMLEFLEKYYRIAKRVITKNNGVWDKAIGDGIMAWFGSIGHDQKRVSTVNANSKYTNDDGALDAIRAAQELRNCFKCLKEELKNEWTVRVKEISTTSKENIIETKGKKKNYFDPTIQESGKKNTSNNDNQVIIPSLSDFDLKCGINTGSARVCLLYNQFTAVGTNVNFASRLQEFAEIDQIVISSSTERKIRKENLVLRKIIINSSNPIKSFEDIDCCYEII